MTTLTIDTAVYLPYLLQRFLSRGGRVVRAKIQHISQVIDGAFTNPAPEAVFVCAGIGARTLGGVEDKGQIYYLLSFHHTDPLTKLQGVYPTRGQVLLLRAPWCRSGWTYQVGSLNGGEGGARTYIIPRYNGKVIVGGTRDVC